jgi:hypothetical protein
MQISGTLFPVPRRYSKLQTVTGRSGLCTAGERAQGIVAA